MWLCIVSTIAAKGILAECASATTDNDTKALEQNTPLGQEYG